MNRRSRWIAIAVLVASAFSLRSASADLVVDGTKSVATSAPLLAGRFDDYCEHRRTVVEGDTLQKFARDAYGDAARVGEIERANPGIVATKLAIGAKVLLPPKLAPPADAKEVLAWRFFAIPWSGSEWETPESADLSAVPGERFDLPCCLVAVPAARAAEFLKILAPHRARSVQGGVLKPLKILESIEAALKKTPFALLAERLPKKIPRASRDSRATACRMTFKIATLGADEQGGQHFVVQEEARTFIDGQGKEVAAAFGFAPSSPLLLIALIGAAGLYELRRRRRAARVG